MTPAQNILIPRTDKVSRSVSNSWNNDIALSTSPTLAFHSPPTSFTQQSPSLRRMSTHTRNKVLKPFATQDIKVLLLENVNQTGQEILKGQGYQVEALKSSLAEDELIEKIK
jgi:D-3-phosphoglycerate dehydrogenase / 2-oxoglutarate reductase